MKRLATFSCLLTVLAFSANAQSLGEKTGVNSTLGLSPATADFVKEAAASDMFEIQSSQLAETKGTGKVKTFAAQMIKDHTQTSADLKALAEGKGVDDALPETVSPAQQSKLDKLSQLTGDAFTKKYDAYQVNAHKDAVSLFKRYATSGDDETIKAWAQKTLPALQGHLAMAKALPK